MSNLKPSSLGFTLIELLIIVATITILAAIAVPNFLEAQTRSKVARTHMDMAELAHALEAYRIDHGASTPNPPELQTFLQLQLDDPLLATERYNAYLELLRQAHDHTHSFPPSIFPAALTLSHIQRLTTPVAYLINPGVDTFSPIRDSIEYLRIFELSRLDPQRISQAHGWTVPFVIFSHGPDLQWHTDTNLPQGIYTEYDPTNGTISRGSIFFMGARPPIPGKAEVQREKLPPSPIPPPSPGPGGTLPDFM
jgi:Tfp pilus assembly protein PilE